MTLCQTLALPLLQVMRENQLAVGDFPDVQSFRDVLAGLDLLSFPAVTPAMLAQVQSVLGKELPALLAKFDKDAL